MKTNILRKNSDLISILNTHFEGKMNKIRIVIFQYYTSVPGGDYMGEFM